MNLDTPCWIWCGPLHAEGYAILYREDKAIRVHRLIYETIYGEIPPDWEVHHLCEVKNCCNPEHLEAMTHRAHCKIHADRLPHDQKTHCKRGHEFTPQNTRMSIRKTANGSRKYKVCKKCEKNKSRKALV